MPTQYRIEIPPGLELKSAILVDDDDWQVGVPWTLCASAWWSRQTEWCTRHDISAFEHYDRLGQLIVIRKLGHGLAVDQCWQLHPGTGEFRDRNNRRASWRGFLQRHPDLAGKLMAAFAKRLAKQAV